MGNLAVRIGNGYDVHRLAPGLPLILGGVRLEHTKGCVAHSDGDVLVHAICDALLGALALGDIGVHFPDTDLAYKGIDSMALLKKVVQLIAGKGYEITNVDAVLALQLPKLKPHIEQMRKNLAEVMGIGTDCVSVKATTTEHLGFEGREEGISAYAVILLQSK